MQVALDLRGEAFAEKLFQAIDTTNTGSVTTEQLVTALLALQDGTLEERIAFTFSIVSSDEGDLSYDQLLGVLQVRTALPIPKTVHLWYSSCAWVTEHTSMPPCGCLSWQIHILTAVRCQVRVTCVAGQLCLHLLLTQYGMALQASCTEGNVKINQSTLEGMAKAFFTKAGKQTSETLTLDDFTKVLRVRRAPSCVRILQTPVAAYSPKLQLSMLSMPSWSQAGWPEPWSESERCIGCPKLQERPEVVENMKLAGLKVSVNKDKDADMIEAFHYLPW